MQAAPLADDLHAGLAPLLQQLAASQDQQAQVVQSLAIVAGWARQQIESGGSTRESPPRVRRASTPQERALDEALMRHFYGTSAASDSEDGATLGVPTT
ncbi:MAG: hypothetical protein GAK31_01365 [Stenotrophomonas maltophilia]|uniref:Uncharacterized protein n=1 Tax=Stenotrophomonas maltophilia TaxID=40324 RepID=A0A7V8JM06_STEMA|nr:MAG: hypothetical protein GAK31_01365 [Stenotrophomonas maltophilia]